MAVAILAGLGYAVTASTGRSELHDYLRSLGASEILDRAGVASGLHRPLDSQRWDGAIDAVGGETLTGLLPGMAERSSVAVCGNAGGPDFTASVYPFILRGVSLLGIESVRFPSPQRPDVWRRIAHDLPADRLEQMTEVHGLADVLDLSARIIKGDIRGRIVIDVNA
jgi:acrylyl-CoA reductase (NADPH)